MIMVYERPAAATIGGVALLERAVNYTLGSLHLVTSPAMSRSTPCRRWDLRSLLRHLDDSLTALHEAASLGRVDVEVRRDGARCPDPVEMLKGRACQVLGAWTNAGPRQELVSAAGCPVTAGIVTALGAVEVAVHGWDIAEACGRPRPIPPALAEDLHELAVLFVTGADRPGRFGAPVRLPGPVSPSDRLVAFLGRDPA